MVIKKILAPLGVVLMSAPLVAAACASGVASRTIDQNHLYFLDKSIQDSPTRKRFRATGLHKQHLSQLPFLNGYYQSKMLVGGYGEGRMFYNGSITERANRVHYHAGLDVVVPQQTALYAPADGTIIGAWWYAPDNQQIADGIGGNMLLRFPISALQVAPELKQFIYLKHQTSKWVIKVPKVGFAQGGIYQPPNWAALTNTLHISPATKNDYDTYLQTLSGEQQTVTKTAGDYIYTFLMHLAKTTINLLDSNVVETSLVHKGTTWKQRIAHIDARHQLAIKAGQKIGFVGETTENGGWTPHVHVETMVFAPTNRIGRALLGTKSSKYQNPYLVPPSVTPQQFSRLVTKLKPIGTLITLGNNKPAFQQLGMSFNTYMMLRYQTFDPNQIYGLYDEQDPIVELSLT